jgi:DNA-binding NarL/FixJ family response regulator
VNGLVRKELPQNSSAVAIVAEGDLAQRRLRTALARWPACRLSSISSLQSLIATNAANDAVVTYHLRLCAQDCSSFKQVKERFPEAAIIPVCECADARTVRRALDSGIDGLVFADELEAALQPTVAAALAGQISVPRDLRRCMPKPSLSPSERKVLDLLLSGCTNSEIGARLFLAESTVKSHLSSAYMKLGVRSRSEAVSLLLESNRSVGIGLSVAAARSDAMRVARGAAARYSA